MYRTALLASALPTARRAALCLSFPAVLAGCSCNDQTFAPLDEPALTDDFGKYLSMDVAPDKSPVIAYYNVTQGALGFAVGKVKPDGKVAWKHEQVDGFSEGGMDSGDVGQFCSMKVAKDGTVWISYYGLKQLRVAHRVDGVWAHETVDVGSGSAMDVGKYTSLQLDADQSPVIAYYDAGNKTLKVARKKDGAWDAETVFEGDAWSGADADGNPVERPADAGRFPRLLIDGSTEYIAFRDDAQQTLELLEGFPGAYTHTTVDASGNVGTWPSLLVDGEDLYIAYEDLGTTTLKVAKREGAGRFQFDTVDEDDHTGADTELFKKGDEVGIMYFDGRHNDIKVALQDKDGWTTDKAAGDSGALGFFNETVAIGEHRYIASYDYTHRTLFWKEL
jgi:hypothetical protein